MSAGYASRLSEYRNKGVCGLPEGYDSERCLKIKLKRLAEWVADSKHLVILTGAGISTSAGIPDFRGPKGVWTLENQKNQKNVRKASKDGRRKEEAVNESGQKRKRPESSTSSSPLNPPCSDFSQAKPTLTHRAITKLASIGKLKFCVTQNVDGLHRRSGLSRSYHAVLHGCAFTEKCAECNTEHFRDEDIGGMSFKPTGRKCDLDGCAGNLHDTLLDWEDPLPEDDFERAERECEKADLVLCLGTSLRIEPAGSLPLKAKKFVIVNLQVTAKDDRANLIIRARVDDVMDELMKRLGYSNWDEDEPPPIERHWKLLG